MKKKFLSFVLLCTMVVTLSACKSESEVSPGEKKTFDKLPMTMKLNNSKLPLTDISVYQSHVDYEWYIYATVSVDISTLNKSEKHWLDKDATETYTSDKTLNPIIYLSSKENSVDFDSMQSHGYSDIGKYRVFFFLMPNTFKNNFNDCETTAVITIKQDKTYESTNQDGKKHEKQKKNEYTYNDDKNIKDISEMPENIKKAFTERLNGTN